GACGALPHRLRAAPGPTPSPRAGGSPSGGRDRPPRPPRWAGPAPRGTSRSAPYRASPPRPPGSTAPVLPSPTRDAQTTASNVPYFSILDSRADRKLLRRFVSHSGSPEGTLLV